MKYLDIGGGEPPSKVDMEVKRIVKLEFKGAKMTIAVTYRFINPNDVVYNRGNYFACAVAVLGDLDMKSAIAMMSVINELHGYMAGYLDSEKHCFPSGFDIGKLEVKLSPSLNEIKPFNTNTSVNIRKVEKFYLNNEKCILNFAYAIFVLNRESNLQSSGFGKDLLIVPVAFKGGTRRQADISKFIKTHEDYDKDIAERERDLFSLNEKIEIYQEEIIDAHEMLNDLNEKIASANNKINVKEEKHRKIKLTFPLEEKYKRLWIILITLAIIVIVSFVYIFRDKGGDAALLEKGDDFYHGINVTPNWSQACDYYHKAFLSGSGKAKESAAKLKANFKDVMISISKNGAKPLTIEQSSAKELDDYLKRSENEELQNWFTSL
jgi:hypothetical protein